MDSKLKARFIRTISSEKLSSLEIKEIVLSAFNKNKDNGKRVKANAIITLALKEINQKKRLNSLKAKELPKINNNSFASEKLSPFSRPALPPIGSTIKL